MRYTAIQTKTEHREEPLGTFLFSGDLASAICQQCDSSPGALILDHLIPEKGEGEILEDWLCRQVRETLALHIQTDDWRGVDGVGVRNQTHLVDIAFSAEDRRWLIERYARHPEVLALWEEACRANGRQLAA